MKKNLLMNTLVVLGIVLSTSVSAMASSKPGTTPEIDPSLAISGLTLLVGSLAVMRAKRSK